MSDRRRAQRLHEEFREAPVGRKRWVKIDVPQAMMVMGRVAAISYNTTHGGRPERYQHKFAPGSRPFLVAGSKPGQLFLVGDKYIVTRRGIVDLDAHGQPRKRPRR